MSCLRYDLKSGISPPQSFSALPQFIVGITRIPLEAQQAPHQRLECFVQQKSKKFKIGNINKSGRVLCGTLPWSECRDLNPRPLGPEPSAIPNFATPRKLLYYKQKNAGCQALNSKTPEILRFFRKTHGNGAQDAAFPAAGGGFGRGMSRTHEGTRRAAAAHGNPCRATARRDASGGNSARTDPAERTFINTAARCRRRTRAAANPWAAAPTESAEAPA